VLLQRNKATSIIGLGQSPSTDNDKIEANEFRLIMPEALSDHPLDSVTIHCQAADLFRHGQTEAGCVKIVSTREYKKMIIH
jgi:hypothetical protein